MKTLAAILFYGFLSFRFICGQECKLDSARIYALINGWEYHYQRTNQEQPFLGSGQWTDGILNTVFGAYNPCPVQYDLFQDQLVTRQIVDGQMILFVVNPLIVKDFIVNNQRFVYFQWKPDSLNQDLSGYYEQVYTGNIHLLVKWKKSVIDARVIAGSNYETSRVVYLQMGNRLYKINNKRSLLSLFPGSKKEIGPVLKELPYNLTKANTSQLVGLMKYLENTMKGQ